MGDQFRKYGVELRMPRGRPGGAGGVGWLIALGAGAVLVNASLYNGAPTTFFFVGIIGFEILMCVAVDGGHRAIKYSR